MIQVLAAINCQISAYAPILASTCILNPPVSITEPESDVFTPVPPGIEYDDLPNINTQIVDTSPNQIIGCVNTLLNQNAQNILNALFPTALNKNGVVNKDNNDIWVYESLTWNNVGPNPGPRVVVATELPPWNEIVSLVGRTRTTLAIESYDYELQISSAIAIKTKTKVLAPKSTVLNVTAVQNIAADYQIPEIIGGATRPILGGIQQIDGTALPVLGITQVSPISLATNAGWTLAYDSTADENSTIVGNFGFSFVLNNISYSSCYVNSNSYITFGGQENVYQNLGASIPSLPKLHLGSGDFSYQRIYTKAEADLFRIRLEGNSVYNAAAGSSNRFVEISIYKTLENGTQFIDVRSGNISGSTSGPFMLATETTALASGTFAANESWVFEGNSSGTSWTLHDQSYVGQKMILPITIENVATTAIEALLPEITTFAGAFATTAQVVLESHLPTISCGKSINVNSANVSIESNIPDLVGNIAFIYLPVIEVAITPETPSGIGESGIALFPQTVTANLLAQNPFIGSGGSIAPAQSIITIAGGIPSGAGEYDRYWSNTSLLLYMEGANNSTTFTDSSTTNLSITALGNARISNARSKFGSTSGYFDGTGDYLSASYNSAFDLLGSPFTIECWIYPETFKAAMRIAATGNSAAWNSTTGIHWLLNAGSTGYVDLQYYTATGPTGITSGVPCTLNTWNHVAASVNGSTAYLAVNGSLVSAVVGAAQRPSVNPLLNICSIPGEAGASNIAFQGNIDNMRITKNIVRYTTSFTPPTKTFPNR